MSAQRLFLHGGNTVTNEERHLDTSKVDNRSLFIKRDIRTLNDIYSVTVEYCSERNSLVSSNSILSTTPHRKSS